MNYAELFVWVLLGHLVGDYWCQNTWMATNKTKPGYLGTKACFVHAGVYSVCVVLFLKFGIWLQGGHWLGIGWWFLGIFIPHLIDRFSLLAYLMQWKNGIHPWKILKPGDPITIEKQWEVAFTAPVYIITDNTAHLLMMWLMIRFLL